MTKATNTVGYQPNWENISQLVAQGYIREVTHPEDPSLKLYNYTPKAQYDQHWTKDVLICRGLIARDGEVIARPFPKFFNWQEIKTEQEEYWAAMAKEPAMHIKDPFDHTTGPWHVYEKADGSLAILYQFAQGDYRIATRGSFTSEQALVATQWIKDVDLVIHDTTMTHLFEIIYPENRIVVDYEGQSKLTLLGCVDTATGAIRTDAKAGYSIDRNKHWAGGVNFDEVKYYGIQDKIPTDQRENHEGYVLVNEQGFRVKVKHDEYVRLHGIITNISSRTIWEYLKEGRDMAEILDNVPDEFYRWVKQTAKDLQRQFDVIEWETCEYFAKKPETEDRKELAEYFKQFKYPFLLFSMLDFGQGKKIKCSAADKTWDLIKPARSTPFGDE